MASSLIRGKYVISRVIDDNSSQIIRDGAIYQRDGEIVEVGRYDDLKARHDPDEVIGSNNDVVLPGLINAHHHTGLTPFQLGVLDLPLEPWITARMRMRAVDTYLDTLYCAMQMIESGITTVMHNDSFWRTPRDSSPVERGERIIQAYKDSGMRAALPYSYRDQNNLVYQDDQTFLSTLPTGLASRASALLQSRSASHQEYFDAFVDLYERFGRNQPEERIIHMLGPVNVQWCSDEFLMAAKEFANRYDTGIHIHVQETIYQKMYGLKAYKKTPLAHLNELGVLGPEVSCAHGVWLTNSDITIMAETGTMLCHNASSNLRLKSGVAPVNHLLAQGVTVAIGIDEAGINDDNDILQEMRLVQKVHRTPGVAVPSLTSHQVLKMATVNGAKATLFGDRIGTLEAGKRADIILVNLAGISEPYLHEETNIVDALLYRGRGTDVDTVIVDGEVIMRDREFTRVNKHEIWARLKENLSRPLDAQEIERGELSAELLPYVNRFYQQWPIQEGRPHYVYNQSE